MIPPRRLHHTRPTSLVERHHLAFRELRTEGIARSILGARFGTISVTMHASLIAMGRLLLPSGIPAAGFKIGSVWNGNSVSLLEIGPWSKLHKLLI